MFRFDPRVHMDLSDKDKMRLEQFERLSKITWFKEATKLTPGQTFGELAMFREETRKARAFCISECYFAILDKQDFKMVLNQIEMRRQEDKIKFIHKLPYMIYQNRSQIKKLADFFSHTNFKRNKVVFTQGEPALYFYVVFQGEF